MTFACTKLFSRNDKLPGFLAFESLTEAGDTIASRLYFTDYPFPPRHPLLHNAKLIPIPLDPSLTSCCFLDQVRIFEFYRAHIAHPFQPPLAVVDVHKAPDRLSHLLQVLEHQAIDNLLLEGPDEAFRHAVGLGLLAILAPFTLSHMTVWDGLTYTWERTTRPNRRFSNP